MKVTESFVSTQSASTLRAAGAGWIEGCWIPGKCGNIRKETNLCPCRILNIVCLILSPLRRQYIHLVLPALEDGEIFHFSYQSAFVFTGSINKCGSVCAFKLQSYTCHELWLLYLYIVLAVFIFRMTQYTTAVNPSVFRRDTHGLQRTGICISKYYSHDLHA